MTPEPLAAGGFRGLIGQARAIRLLQQSVRAGRLAHGYLFAGPEGVGKKRVALALAQALNCEAAGAVDDGCGTCRSCQKIARGLHPDVQVIEAGGGSLKIEQVRALEADAAMGLYEGRRKVFVIDGAERLTAEAANALLKTLEEPPGSAILILITTSAAALPSTIVSRCQTVVFPRISDDELERYLVRQGIDRAEVSLIVSFSGGSLARALSRDVASLVAARDRLLEAVGQGLQAGPAALIELAEQETRDRDGLRQRVELLAAWLRDLMVARVSRNRELLVNRDREGEIMTRAEVLPLRAILDGLREVHAALEALARNANPRLTFEHLLIRLREVMPSGLARVSS
jgi:DNA polymerase-3 subunit delta'